MGNITKTTDRSNPQKLDQLIEKAVNQTLPIKSDLAGLDTDEQIMEQLEESQQSATEETDQAIKILQRKTSQLEKKLVLKAEQKKLKWALQSIINFDSFFPKELYCQKQPEFSVKFTEILETILNYGNTHQITAFYCKVKQNFDVIEIQVLNLSEGFNKFGSKFLLYENYRLSEECFQFSLILLQKQGKKNEDYANIVNNYGVLLMKMNKKYSALECYNQSLKIYQKISGMRTQQYADVIYNIALVLQAMGKKAESLQKFYLNLAINEQLGGRMSLRCADSCHKIGVVLLENSRDKEAVFYLRRCFMILLRYDQTSSKKFETNKKYLEKIVKKNRS